MNLVGTALPEAYSRVASSGRFQGGSPGLPVVEDVFDITIYHKLEIFLSRCGRRLLWRSFLLLWCIAATATLSAATSRPATTARPAARSERKAHVIRLLQILEIDQRSIAHVCGVGVFFSDIFFFVLLAEKEQTSASSKKQKKKEGTPPLVITSSHILMRALTHQSRFDPNLFITRYLLNPPSGKYLKTANILPHATNMLNYLCSELLELAGNITNIDHRVVVKRADVEARY